MNATGTPPPATLFHKFIYRLLLAPQSIFISPLVQFLCRLFLDNWDKGFMEAPEEPEGYWVDVVYGSIPKDMTGTLFRNGPNKFNIGGEALGHPYDGDGFVGSVAIKDGAAYFRSRFVKTAE